MCIPVQLERNCKIFVSYAVPASGKGEPGFVFLCVFVCLCYQYLAFSLGKFTVIGEEKAAIPGTKVAPLERLKCGCLLLGTHELL